MSTNKTTNYNLHSWSPSDDFLLTEINANFTAIDGAVSAEATARASAIATAKSTLQDQITALNTAVAGKAEQSVVSSLATALSAKCRVVSGTYTGNGLTGWRTIDLGFRPAVVVVEQKNCARIQNVFLGGMAVDAMASDAIAVTDTGFQVEQGTYDLMNNSGTNYMFFALV